MLSTLKLCLAGLAYVSAAGKDEVDYTQNGLNWKGGCLKPNQSPIDLKRDAKLVDPKDEHFYKFYQDLPNREVKWLAAPSTTQVSISTTAGSNKELRSKPSRGFFRSKFGQEVFKTPKTFQALQFHFHAGSEHTIEGKRYEMEMHTVHFPRVGTGKNSFIAAAVGIIFDTKDYDKDVTADQVATIDAFFDSLAMNENDPPNQYVLYGQLLQAMDSTQRWVYKGSVTTPPCATLVYWNVHKKVYPIKQRHLDQYRNQLKRQTNQDIVKTGNFRVAIEPKPEHDLHFISDNTENQQVEEVEDDMEGYKLATILLAIFLCPLVAALIAISFMLGKQGTTYHESANTERTEQSEKEGGSFELDEAKV